MNQLMIFMLAHSAAQTIYQPTCNSLKNHTTPQWLKDSKFGYKDFLDQWKGKIVEVIDKYDPDFI